MRWIFILLLGFVLAACQSSGTKAVENRKKNMSIEGFAFSRTVTTDKNDSSFKILEFRPSRLPYTGVIGQMSAQDRWIRLFEKSLEAVSEECGKPISGLPEVKGDEANYFKLGKSNQYPKFVRTRFSCK